MIYLLILLVFCDHRMINKQRFSPYGLLNCSAYRTLIDNLFVYLCSLQPIVPLNRWFYNNIYALFELVPRNLFLMTKCSVNSCFYNERAVYFNKSVIFDNSFHQSRDKCTVYIHVSYSAVKFILYRPLHVFKCWTPLESFSTLVREFSP